MVYAMDPNNSVIKRLWYISFLISPEKKLQTCTRICFSVLFVCVEVLRPSQPNGVMSSTVSLPNHTFTGQA